MAGRHLVDFDVGLNTAMRKLRQALGDDADEPRYIETLAKRGYRFVAPVSDMGAVPVPTITDFPPVIAETSPPIKTSIAEAPLSFPSDVTATRSPDGGGDSMPAAGRMMPRWYWVLAASCALALVTYGAVVYLGWFKEAPARHGAARHGKSTGSACYRRRGVSRWKICCLYRHHGNVHSAH